MQIIYYNRERKTGTACAPLSEAVKQHITRMETNNFSDAWTPEMIAETLQQSYNHVWLAKDSEVCGYLLANRIGDETELLRIAVEKPYRTQGVGMALLEAYHTFAQQSCLRGLLEVRRGNIAAKHLYEKKGYHLLASRKNYYKHPDEDADIYEITFTENGDGTC